MLYKVQPCKAELKNLEFFYKVGPCKVSVFKHLGIFFYSLNNFAILCAY